MSCDAMPTKIEGRCQCGALRVAAMPPSKWMAHCHCGQCRRAHGAGFVTWLGFDEARCEIDDTEQTLRWYASSPPAQRGFCVRCGSTMFFRSSRWPGELHLAAGILDDAPDRSPHAHVHWGNHVDWSGSDPDDGLPRES